MKKQFRRKLGLAGMILALASSVPAADYEEGLDAFARGDVASAFRESRIVAFSTLCVYPFTPVTGGGESHASAD